MTQGMRSMKWGALALTAGFLMTACGGDGAGTGPGPGPSGSSVSLSLAVGGGGGAQASLAPALNLILDDGTSTLVIDRVAIVLREIELERQFDSCPDGSGSSDDGCEKFEVGPILLDLPMDGGVSQAFSIQVPADVYDELEFDIHKPSGGGDAANEAFLLAHPEFDDVSIRVEGTFDGQPFVFLQDLMEKQEIDLVPPLVVDGVTPTNLTLTLDIATWFVTSGGALIDPGTANKGGQNENMVEDNIKTSIDAFEDRDRDGELDG